MPSFRTCWSVSFGLLVLAATLGPTKLRAQVASEFSPTFDSGTRGAPRFERRTQPVSAGPTRFGAFQPAASTGATTDAASSEDASVSNAAAGSSAGTTGFDSSNARKKKAARKAKAASLAPPPLSGADTAAARAIARSAPQLYRREVILPEPGTTAPVPTLIVPVHRRPPPDLDPFAPVGVHVGSFLFKPALEVNGGFDSNPLRIPDGPSAGTLALVPELRVNSEWRRHELKAELRGSYLMYSRTFENVNDNSPSGAPKFLDRPDFEGKANGRLDVHDRSHADAEARLTVGTDNPGSPNITAGLERLPIFTRVGGSLGYTQNFNRVDVTLKGGIDRIDYQNSVFTDGSTQSNDDRNYNQYSMALRGSYELRPGVTPFAEVSTDRRVHDLYLDRNGINRDSDAIVGRVGSTFELTRQLTGEISAGYLTRNFKDESLKDLSGFVADASLVWVASGLTTVTLTAKSSTDESIVADISGLFRRDVALQVDHAFRRWLVGTMRLGAGLDTYETNDATSREDRRFFVAAALVYKLSREWQVKGEVRRDWLDSNVANVDYTADTVLVGVRWQR